MDIRGKFTQQTHVKKLVCTTTPLHLYGKDYLLTRGYKWLFEVNAHYCVERAALLQDLNTTKHSATENCWSYSHQNEKKCKIKRLQGNYFNSFYTWSNCCLDWGWLVGEIVRSVIETADTMLIVKMSVLSLIKRKTQLPILVLYFLPWLPKRALI